MIITRTPIRVSFLGGGTDYPAHYRLHGGQTLGVAIDKYSFITVNRLAKLFDYSIRVSYSRLELADHVDAIEHPAVRECMRFLGIEGGIEIHYVGDLPARTGLGSSSSFTVGLLHALHALKGELVCRRQLAEEAVFVEQELIKERVGVQDQFTCAHGGLVHLRFDQEGGIHYTPLPLSGARISALQDHLMLFFTGMRRHAHEILEEQITRTEAGCNHEDLCRISELVSQGIGVLASEGSLLPFGELLHDAWVCKRKLSSRVSNAAIDECYDAARRAGAIGGKLLGAGGGGFLLLFVDPERKPEVRRALSGLAEVSSGFDFNGSSLLFYQPG